MAQLETKNADSDCDTVISQTPEMFAVSTSDEEEADKIPYREWNDVELSHLQFYEQQAQQIKNLRKSLESTDKIIMKDLIKELQSNLGRVRKYYIRFINAKIQDEENFHKKNEN